jgi:hypothetical protein
MKFVLLHEAKNDDGIKSFFNDVWELYVKVRAVFRKEIDGDVYNEPSDDAKPFPHRSLANTKSDI